MELFCIWGDISCFSLILMDQGPSGTPLIFYLCANVTKAFNIWTDSGVLHLSCRFNSLHNGHIICKVRSLRYASCYSNSQNVFKYMISTRAGVLSVPELTGHYGNKSDIRKIDFSFLFFYINLCSILRGVSMQQMCIKIYFMCISLL